MKDIDTVAAAIDIATIDKTAADTIAMVEQARQIIRDSQRELEQIKNLDTANGELYLLCRTCGTKWPCPFAGQTGHTRKAIYSVGGKTRYIRKADAPELREKIQNRKSREIRQDRILRAANVIRQANVATMAAKQALSTDIIAIIAER